jgi:hypothetical protein
MPQLNVANLLDRVQSKIGTVVASIADVRTIPGNKKFAQAILTFSTFDAPRERLALAVAEAFDNQASLVEGSLVELPHARQKAAVCFIRLNREVVAFTEDLRKRVVNQGNVEGANIMVDPVDDKLWEYKKTASGEYLVRCGEEDISSLVALASASVDRPGPRLRHLSSVTPQVNKFPGEYVAFLDVKHGEVRHGYAFANTEEGVYVAARRMPNGVDECVVPEMLIVQSAPAQQPPRSKVIAAPTGDKSTLLDYYKKVYEYDPEYFKLWEQMINESALA